MRFPRDIGYVRERIDTPDGDFLDIDWSRPDRQSPATPGSRTDQWSRATRGTSVAILSHGLEGSSQRAYIKGMASALNRHGWDVAAWNCRGCSGEPNRRLSSYHSGSSRDLKTVIDHVADDYDTIALVGFSLGGNLTLKHLGEMGPNTRASAAAVFSVPCDLAASSTALARPVNRIYMKHFLVSLRNKIQAKMRLFPGLVDDTGYARVRTFRDFDDRYTAPLHGFRDAEDYWTQCSSRQFIPEIRIPTLLVSAQDDPFLAPECFPVAEARKSPFFHLEIPGRGGHVGFNNGRSFYSETRTVQFLTEVT